MRAYHRVDPLMDERKSHYTPAQLGAFVKVQLVAGRQAAPGRFRSMKGLLGSLPSAYARLVPFLVEQGDLVTQSDGTVYLDGWDEWQEGDLTVKERMARLRNRQRNNGVTDAVTEPSLSANARESLSVGVDVGIGVEPPQPPDDPSDDDHLDTWYRLTASWPSDRVAPWLNQLAEEHGSAELSKALAEEVMADSDRSTLISRTRNRLERSAHFQAKAKEQQRKERDAAREAARQKEIEEMAPEQRKANLDRLAAIMAQAGLPVERR